jgi:hypothetical protein
MQIVIDIPGGKVERLALLYFESRPNRSPENIVFDLLEDKIVAWARAHLSGDGGYGLKDLVDATDTSTDESAAAIAERVRQAELARGYAAAAYDDVNGVGEGNVA